jgi:hypothetical protein
MKLSLPSIVPHLIMQQHQHVQSLPLAVNAMNGYGNPYPAASYPNIANNNTAAYPYTYQQPQPQAQQQQQQQQPPAYTAYNQPAQPQQQTVIPQNNAVTYPQNNAYYIHPQQQTTVAPQQQQQQTAYNPTVYSSVLSLTDRYRYAERLGQLFLTYAKSQVTADNHRYWTLSVSAMPNYYVQYYQSPYPLANYSVEQAINFFLAELFGLFEAAGGDQLRMTEIRFNLMKKEHPAIQLSLPSTTSKQRSSGTRSRSRSPNDPRSSRLKDQISVCVHYITGTCQVGRDCSQLHLEAEKGNLRNTIYNVCSYYQTANGCKLNSRCKLQHNKVTADKHGSVFVNGAEHSGVRARIRNMELFTRGRSRRSRSRSPVRRDSSYNTDNQRERERDRGSRDIGKQITGKTLEEVIPPNEQLICLNHLQTDTCQRPDGNSNFRCQAAHLNRTAENISKVKGFCTFFNRSFNPNCKKLCIKSDDPECLEGKHARITVEKDSGQIIIDYSSKPVDPLGLRKRATMSKGNEGEKYFKQGSTNLEGVDTRNLPPGSQAVCLFSLRSNNSTCKSANVNPAIHYHPPKNDSTLRLLSGYCGYFSENAAINNKHQVWCKLGSKCHDKHKLVTFTPADGQYHFLDVPIPSEIQLLMS